MVVTKGQGGKPWYCILNNNSIQVPLRKNEHFDLACVLNLVITGANNPLSHSDETEPLMRLKGKQSLSALNPLNSRTNSCTIRDVSGKELSEQQPLPSEVFVFFPSLSSSLILRAFVLRMEPQQEALNCVHLVMYSHSMRKEDLKSMERARQLQYAQWYTANVE